MNGRAIDLPAWVPLCLKKLIAGLLTVDVFQRLTASQANKILNETVAQVYLSDFWVFQNNAE